MVPVCLDIQLVEQCLRDGWMVIVGQTGHITLLCGGLGDETGWVIWQKQVQKQEYRNRSHASIVDNG